MTNHVNFFFFLNRKSKGSTFHGIIEKEQGVIDMDGKLNPYIFRGYDIRGVVPTDINSDVAYLIGRGFASKIKQLKKKCCVVGYDNRLSSKALHDALIQGISESGIDVVDLSLTTTPMYYFACKYFQIDSGIMITASHNPKDENGFKFAFSDYQNAKGQEITDFYQFIVEGNFAQGKGAVRKASVKNEYFQAIQDGLSFGSRRVKVALDPGNGTTAIILKELYSKFPVDIVLINGESDGNFPNHHPDPSVEENLAQLKEVVIKENCDVGLSFDGDGDRVGVISNTATFIPMDYYMIMIIRDIIHQVENKTFLYDVKCSKSLEDEILKLGGTPYCYRTGNSYTKAKVEELDLAFGGELSGHVYFRDHFLGFDSGLYAGLRLLEILSKTTKSVDELLEGIHKYHSTPEIKYPTKDAIKLEVIDQIKQYCIEKGYEVNEIDGIRVTFADGWAGVRASNTGPNITGRYEATTQQRLFAIKEEFETLILKYNQVSSF